MTRKQAEALLVMSAKLSLPLPKMTQHKKKFYVIIDNQEYRNFDNALQFTIVKETHGKRHK